MLLSFTSLAAALILWNATATKTVPVEAGRSNTINKIEGRIVAHADLNGDGSQELIVSLPNTCDDGGSCVFTVVQVQAGGYRTLLRPTKMWDLSVSSDTASDWSDLVEAGRQGAAMDAITIVRWRFDGRVYRRVDGSEEALPTTPSWISNTLPRRGGCLVAGVG